VIVHVITNLRSASGGPTSAVVELAREQAARGEAIRILCDEPLELGSAAPTRWEGLDVQVLPASGASRCAPMRRAEIQRQLAELTPRVVHLHGAWDPILRRAASACASMGTPWVVSSHGMLHPFTLRQRRLKKLVYLALFPRVLASARAVLTLNAEEAAAVERRFGVSAIVAPTGIDHDAYGQHVDGSFSRSLPGLGGRPFILFLGRLDPIKGVDRLIEAFAAAAGDGMTAHLVLAGPDSGAERSLRQQVARLGLSERVHFVGPLAGERKLQALSECALFAHRPRYEGFGIAVVEAMAAGRPVVTTAACRLDGAAEAGALLLAEDETAAFAKALVRLADDQEASRALGARAKAWVCRELAWPSILARVERGYRA
jgi:glycosyltransferase involved in cell wall biosynthesis